ncbi:MAG: hypothetical protein KDA96_04860 [Planctomycetaceae bacterium]|nr:hypothetical protein [Planctomycetaceae bacterium]
MKRWTLSGIGAFQAAILTGIAWWILNDFVRRGGQGFLEQQPFPLSNQWVCVLIGAGLGAVGGIVVAVRQEKQSQGVAQWCREHGLQYQSSIERSGLGESQSMLLFKDWTAATDAGFGTVDGSDLMFFELKTRHTTQTSKGSSTQVHYETVFLLPLGDSPLPPVLIRRKNMASMVSLLLDFEGVSLLPEDDSADSESTAVLQEFNRQFLVARSDNNTELSDEQWKERLCQGLSLPLMRTLMSGSKWDLEVGQTHVAVWVRHRRIPASQLTERLAEVCKINGLIHEAPSHQMMFSLKAEGQASAAGNVGFGNIGCLFASAVAGMFCAFALFIPIFLFLASDYPWIVLLWPFFGMAIIVLFLRIGRALQKRWSSKHGG